MKDALYVDTERLDELIKNSGYKIGFIASALGLSREGFLKKRNGEIAFRKLEQDALASILGMTDEERAEIFLP